jgi:hypothetical protein
MVGVKDPYGRNRDFLGLIMIFYMLIFGHRQEYDDGWFWSDRK